jgi:hypothetical protein
VTLTVLVFVVTIFSGLLAFVVAYRLVADAYLGRVVDPAASLRFGLRRLGAAVLLALAGGLVIFVVCVVLLGVGTALGSAGLGFGFLLAFVFCAYLAVVWSVIFPVLLGEHRRGFAAILGSLRRSRALVRGRFWRCAAVLGLMLLLQLIVIGGITVVVDAITSSSSDSTVLFLDRGVSSLISNTLVLPFQVAVTTVLYIDLRVRKEGFDVQLLTHSLEPGGAGVT